MLIRQYNVFGFTFENRRDKDGIVYPVVLAPASLDDVPESCLQGVDWLLEYHFVGDLPDLPEALRARRACYGYRVGVTPMEEKHRPVWEEVRTQWIEKTGVDPGEDIARLAWRDDPRFGLAPWPMLIELLEEVTRDRLDPEPWWLFRVPALVFRPRDDERERLASIESRASAMSTRVEPWRKVDDFTMTSYVELMAELRARGFFDWQIGRTTTNEVSRWRTEWLAKWGLSMLLSYHEAMERQWYSRLKNVSLEWFRHPQPAPPGVPADTWLARCAAAAAEVPAFSSPSAEVEASIEGHRVLLQLRREEGPSAALVAARLLP